ncbi:MAG: preprotein translocase subunit SecE [Nitrospirae bacterium]|jgi:preprotein translocase subunit SecE|nr:MAG: preprotein translocase subunit SecE [Nitrospirota bacterium]
MLTQSWNSTKEFLLDVRAELRKVTYPTYSETIGSTTVVIVLVMIVSIFLALADLILVRLIGRII